MIDKLKGVLSVAEIRKLHPGPAVNDENRIRVALINSHELLRNENQRLLDIIFEGYSLIKQGEIFEGTALLKITYDHAKGEPDQ